MLVYRSLVLGLLGACVMLLAQRPVAYIHVAAPSAEQFTAPAPNVPPTIIDVSTSLCAQPAAAAPLGTATCDTFELGSLLHLAPDERVVALQDQRIDAVAGLNVVTSPKAAGNYLDLTITSPRGERRVLVLMH